MIKKPIIFDTDPGIDDAIALALALKCEELDIKLVTTVAGNVGIENTTRNANNLLHLYGFNNIPVAKGASKPLIVKYDDASEYHGKNGLGNIELENSPSKVLDNAIEEMKNLITSSKEKITIVALGPLTNIALLIKTYPNVIDNIEEIVLMGGAIGRGNKDVLVEYNIGADPHAAKIVFDSEIKKTMVGLEMGDNAKIGESDFINSKDKIGEFCHKLLVQYKGEKEGTVSSVYDATAIAYLVKPEIFETKYLYVDVEIEGKYTKGATIVDLKGIMNEKPNTYVPVKIDANKFKELLVCKIIK